MDTEEQASPPDPELLNRQPKWFKPVLYLCIGASVLFAIVLLLVAPPMMRTTNRGYQAEAINNARQIGLALLEFEMDYGYPNGTTVAAVTKRFPAHGFDLTGSSSNALFRQLFAAELTYSELMFYAKTKDCKKPDGIITRGEALKRNEIGFSYNAGLTSTGADPLTPIVLTPLIPGTTKFDPKPFDGKAIILHIDNSVRTYDIAKDGHIYDAKGINLLSPKHPIWKGKAPDIRYPE